eukprot:COSAG06_NODE_1503_length_9254_cov_9.994975_4_plen_98_part_00
MYKWAISPLETLERPKMHRRTFALPTSLSRQHDTRSRRRSSFLLLLPPPLPPLLLAVAGSAAILRACELVREPSFPLLGSELCSTARTLMTRQGRIS